MTTFEKLSSIGFLLLFIFGFKPAIKNFLLVYRNREGKLSKGMHIFTTLYFGMALIAGPAVCAFVIYMMSIRTTIDDYIFWK